MAKRTYGKDEIREALEVLAVAGSDYEAARRLEGVGRSIPRETIRDWRNEHADLYAQIKANTDERQAQESDHLAYRQARAGHLLLDRLEKEYTEIPAKELPAAIRNTETARGIAITKSLELRGKPTQIVEHRTYRDALEELRNLGVIEGTAQEIDALELDAGG